jgi:hypothetical protein
MQVVTTALIVWLVAMLLVAAVIGVALLVR